MTADLFSGVSSVAGWWCVRVAFSQTILWLIAGCAVWLLRRSSAAVRHRVWALSVLVALGIPLTVGTCPTIGLGWIETPKDRQLPEATHSFESGVRKSALGGGLPRDVGVDGRASDSHAHLLAAADTHTATDAVSGVQASDRIEEDKGFWRAAFVWFVVVPPVWGLWRIARALLTARRIIARSVPINDGGCLQACQSIADALGWRGAVALQQSGQTRVPLCLGLKNPRIILPEDWRQWPPEMLRALMTHELSHVVRRDVAWQLVARLACTLYWFQPLAWLAAWRMRVEREYACDDSVLCMGQTRKAYAQMLLDMAERLSAETSRPNVAVAMVVQSGLESRVRAILTGNRVRRPPGRRTGLALLLATLIAFVAASTVSPFSRTSGSEHAADPHPVTRVGAFDASSERTKLPTSVLQETMSPRGIVAGGNMAEMEAAVAHDPEIVAAQAPAIVTLTGAGAITFQETADSAVREVNLGDLSALTEGHGTLVLQLDKSVASGNVAQIISVLRRGNKVNAVIVLRETSNDLKPSSRPLIDLTEEGGESSPAAHGIVSVFEHGRVEWRPSSPLNPQLSKRIETITIDQLADVVPRGICIRVEADKGIRFMALVRVLDLLRQREATITVAPLSPTAADIVAAQAPPADKDRPAVAQEQPENPRKPNREKEAFTAWGKKVGGLQAGLGFRPGKKRAYHHGETVTVVLRVRNPGDESDGMPHAVDFKHIWAFFVENPPTITDADGKRVQQSGLAALGAHHPSDTNVAPGKEVALYEWEFELRPQGEGSKNELATIHGVGKFSLQCERVVGPTHSNPNHPNPALDKLATGKLELEVQDAAASLPNKDQPQQGAKLQPGTEEKLEWGEPVNGLRLALAWPPTLGEPAVGEVPDFYLAVQNVSPKPLRLCTTADAPNKRRLTIMTAGVPQSRTESEEPNGTDVTLQPREVVFLRLFPEQAMHSSNLHRRGTLIASILRQSPTMTVLADMEIKNAPAGAWTGKLIAPGTRAGVNAEAPKNR